MKKSVLIAVVIAAVSIFAGVILLAAAMIGVNFDVMQFNTVQMVQNAYEIEDVFSEIVIDVVESDVRFIASEDDVCVVQCTEYDEEAHQVSVKNGTLFITRVDTRDWYETFSIRFGEDSYAVTVSLPQTAYDSLQVTTVSGEIAVPKELTFGEAELGSTSGDICFYGSCEDLLELHTISGDQELFRVHSGALVMGAVSGDLDLSQVTVAGDMTLQTTSGDTELEQVTADGQMQIDTTSGEIDLEYCDAGSLSLGSTSGDVSAVLLSPKHYTVSTISGAASVPKSQGNAPCEVSTVSGDIRISVK